MKLGRIVLAGLGWVVLVARPGLGQSITLDGTLGPAGTLVGPVYEIEQGFGTTVGENLFQSFGRFDLAVGEVAVFGSDGGVRNILGRVTGGTASSIDGLLFTDSDAVNLFLINPSGILFGPNARLNIGGTTRGSFLATTVDAVVWPDGGRFDGVEPQGAGALLNIVGDPSGFWGSQSLPQEISVRGSTLGVYPGQNIFLIGGNVTLDNAYLGFFRLPDQGGRIAIAGISGTGLIGLNTNQNDWQLTIPNTVPRSNVTIQNESIINASPTGGSIDVSAQNLDISGDSRLRADLGLNSGSFVNQRAGAINFEVLDTLTIRGDSLIGNRIESGNFGTSGGINIEAGSLLIIEGSQLGTIIDGIGDAGSVKIKADNQILIDGGGIFSQISPYGVGQAGSILVDAGSLQISNGGQLGVDTSGDGDGGNIEIITTGKVIVDGEGSEGFPSKIFSQINFSGRGQAGSILVDAGSLQISNGGQLAVDTFGFGDGGDIQILATDKITLDNGFLTSFADDSAVGNGGSIRILAGDSLEVLNGSQLVSSASAVNWK